MLWVAPNLLAVVWCFGAAGLALAAHVRRRATAAGAIGLARGRPVSPALCRGLVGAAATLSGGVAVSLLRRLRTVIGMHDPRPDIVALLAASLALSGVCVCALCAPDL